MAKVTIKAEKLIPLGGIFPIIGQFVSLLSSLIGTTLGLRCKLYSYQYSVSIRFLLCVYFCDGTGVKDVTTHLAGHLSLHHTLLTCSTDTILKATNELVRTKHLIHIRYRQVLWFQYGRHTLHMIEGMTGHGCSMDNHRRTIVMPNVT